MNKKILASAIISVLSFGVMAETPSFDYVELGFSNYDVPGRDSDGFEIKGSKDISEHFYVAGDYADLSADGFSNKITTIGFGYKNNFSTASTFFAELDYARIDTDISLFLGDSTFNTSFDRDGYEMTFGVRSMLTDKFELKAAVEYLDIDNDDLTSMILGGAYNITDKISLYADYKYDSDLTRYDVGVRFNF